MKFKVLSPPDVGTKLYPDGRVTAKKDNSQVSTANTGDIVTLTVTPETDYVLAENGLRVTYLDSSNLEKTVRITVKKK